MKYVKLFEDYYDINNETICDLEDICLELKDAGFDVDIRNITSHVMVLSISKMKKNKMRHHLVRLHESRSSFRFTGLVKETVLRIKQYLGGDFISFEARFSDDIIFKDVDDNTKSRWINMINIRIK